MDNFEAIKDIWLSEKAAALPDSAEISKTIRGFLQKRKRNTRILIVLVTLVTLGMCGVVMFYHSKYLSTTIGEIIIFIGILFVFVTKFETLKKINVQELKSNQDFLTHYKKQLNKKSRVNKYQLVAFILLVTGYALYLYEAVSRNTKIMFMSYALFAVVFAAMWFIYRPYMEKRDKKKKQQIIENIESINQQIQD